MPSREERLREMRNASRRAAYAADRELSTQLELIRQAGAADIRALKPQLSDPEAFNALLKAVKEATAANETQAQLRRRIKDLGEAALSVLREAAGILS